MQEIYDIHPLSCTNQIFFVLLRRKSHDLKIKLKRFWGEKKLSKNLTWLSFCLSKEKEGEREDVDVKSQSTSKKQYFIFLIYRYDTQVSTLL